MLGLGEVDLIEGGRETIFVGDAFVHRTTPDLKWPVGRFECPSVAQLKCQLEEQTVRDGGHGAALTVVDGIDIGELQATLKTEDRAMVQIASNFNCLEVPNRGCPPDYGRLVTGYATDSTQGPAASFGVPAASLFRAHYPFFEAGTPPSEWGQTKDRQIELLSDVARFYGRCNNGKVTLTGKEEALTPDQVTTVADAIRVGIQSDAEVVFGRGANYDKPVELLPRPYALVDQVLSASVNWNSCGSRPPQGILECLTRAALRASYDGAYLSAMLRGRHLLLLTLIGGGVFDNPEDMILQEVAAAHARWCHHPKCSIREVRVCLFQDGVAERIEAVLRDYLESQ